MKGKRGKKIKPAIEIVEEPAPASSRAKYALESQRFHAEAEQSDLSRIQKYHQGLQPDRKRLETALAQFDAIAPEAKKQLREIESHRWAGGSIPTGNLAEEVAKLRGYLFGGVGFTKSVDIQLKNFLPAWIILSRKFSCGKKVPGDHWKIFAMKQAAISARASPA